MPARGAVIARCALSALVGASSAPAQVVLDGTFGTAGELSPDGLGNIAIEERFGARSGGNLFHSFGEFGIESGTSAVFSSDGPGIDNVLARVTGSNPSQIDGLLRSTIPGADLYLFNPQGVMFGPDASLNLGGSFHLATAQQLEFAGSGVFSADSSLPVTLTAAEPSAWGFLNDTPNGVSLAGSSLAVASGRTISITSGPISIAGRGADLNSSLVARSGTIELVSTGAIQVAESALLDASGDGSGTLRIRGERLVFDSSSAFVDNEGDSNGSPTAIDIAVTGDMTLRNGSDLTNEVFAEGQGGDVRVSVGGSLALESNSNIAVIVTDGPGDSGALVVQAGSIKLSDGSKLLSRTAGAGSAGDVSIHAGEIEVVGRTRNDPSQLLALIGSVRRPGADPSPGGDVSITAENLTLSAGGQVSVETRGAGDAGSLELTVSDRLHITGSAEVEDSGSLSRKPSGVFVNEGSRTALTGVGFAGGASIGASQVVVEDGGSIARFSFVEGDRLGERAVLRIDTDDIILRGERSALSVGARDRDAGILVLTADSLRVLDGASVSASTFGAGIGGRLELTSSQLEISQSGLGGIFAQTTSLGPDAGPGGDIEIRGKNLTLSDGGRISVASLGPADAGGIRVELSGDLSSVRSEITSEARDTSGGGGNIELLAAGEVYFFDSEVSSSVVTLAGAGGDIRIGESSGTSPQIVVVNRSRILANADTDTPGNISIVARDLLLSADSQLQASNSLGIQGEITISSPEEDLAEEAAPLNATFVDASELLGSGCNVRETPRGSLTLIGRLTTPSAHDNWLPAVTAGPTDELQGPGDVCLPVE